MLVIFDDKLHWFQSKLVLLLVANGSLLLLKINFHPSISLVILLFLSFPMSHRFETRYQAEIQQCLLEDELLCALAAQGKRGRAQDEQRPSYDGRRSRKT